MFREINALSRNTARTYVLCGTLPKNRIQVASRALLFRIKSSADFTHPATVKNIAVRPVAPLKYRFGVWDRHRLLRFPSLENIQRKLVRSAGYNLKRTFFKGVARIRFDSRDSKCGYTRNESSCNRLDVRIQVFNSRLVRHFERWSNPMLDSEDFENVLRCYCVNWGYLYFLSKIVNKNQRTSVFHSRCTSYRYQRIFVHAMLIFKEKQPGRKEIPTLETL